MRKALIAPAIVAATLLGTASAGSLQQPTTPTVLAPAGDYVLDASHSTLDFRLNHLGLSMYSASFARFDARLRFDPARPSTISVTANIDPRSLTLPTPPAGFVDTLLGAQWLDAGRFPTIGFRSTRVEPTGANTARITGDLTLHGQTRPVTLNATFNGSFPANEQMGPARLGFSAQGTIRRSEFGIPMASPNRAAIWASATRSRS